MDSWTQTALVSILILQFIGPVTLDKLLSDNIYLMGRLCGLGEMMYLSHLLPFPKEKVCKF